MGNPQKYYVMSSFETPPSAGIGAGIYFLPTQTIPVGALVTKVLINKIDNLVGGGTTTIKIRVGSTDISDLMPIANYQGGAGYISDADVGGANLSPIKITTASYIGLFVAQAPVTDGAFNVIVEYIFN